MSKLLFLVLLSVTCAQAEEVISLEPVYVKAQKNVTEFNFSEEVTIPTSQLEAEPSGLIAPQLNQIPGVVANQNGGPGGRVSFFIRGTESRHVAFTLDGMKLNDPSNVDRQFDSAFLSAPFLKQVDVHKGPQAVLFGSDSLGGLVEMTTRKGENANETRVDLNGGSFGTLDTSIGQDWKTEKSRGTLTGYRFHSDGFSRLNKKRFDAAEKDSSDITQLSSSSNHQWANKIDTDLLFSFLRGENELDGNSADNSFDESRNDQYIAQQKTNLKLSKETAVSLRNGFNRHNRIIDSLRSGVPDEDTFEGGILQNEILYRHNVENLSLLGGAATEHESFEQADIDKSFDLHSLFLQSALRFQNLKFQLGGRAERHTRYGSFYTGSGGVGFRRENHHFALQYSQGFKAPSLYQLHAPPSFGFPIGNDELEPERNHSWEGSWRYLQKRYDLGLTLFQNRLSNLITYTDAFGYVNQARFIAEGIETSAKYRHEAYQLNASFTHQQFREEETTVLRRPLNSFIAGLAVFPTDSSEVSLRGRWYSSRKDVNENFTTTKLNGYEVFDLGLRYLFTDVDLGLQILNILDRDYEELYGYNIMPRSLFAHTGFRF